MKFKKAPSEWSLGVLLSPHVSRGHASEVDAGRVARGWLPGGTRARAPDPAARVVQAKAMGEVK